MKRSIDLMNHLRKMEKIMFENKLKIKKILNHTWEDPDAKCKFFLKKFQDPILKFLEHLKILFLKN